MRSNLRISTIAPNPYGIELAARLRDEIAASGAVTSAPAAARALRESAGGARVHAAGLPRSYVQKCARTPRLRSRTIRFSTSSTVWCLAMGPQNFSMMVCRSLGPHAHMAS